jgi:predicted nucleotidyltransferase component of viral defense system
MPLTDFQAALGRLLAENRSEDSYLAGGAAILASPNTQRFSRDLDYFQDSAARVATAYEADHRTLIDHEYDLQIEISQPGYIRVVARRDEEATKIEWAQDSTWRFMPVMRSEDFGYQLHPVDLATNKVLALAGRNEARDLVDTLYLHENVLALGPLVWAAVGKDPGFSPLSLLELLRRRGKIQPEDLNRLQLVEPIDPQHLKTRWNDALDGAEAFVRRRPPGETGCLYFAPETQSFVDPDGDGVPATVPHHGRPGGVLPRTVDG